MANETSNGVRDVNEEFRLSKMQQIEKAENKAEWLRNQIETGAMTAIGNDQYRVNQGWDRGEVITVRIKENAAAEILANHGLDTKADGTTALYLKDRPAWHSLGTVIPGGLSSSEGVLRAAGLDWETILTPQGGINPVTGKYEEVGEWFENTNGEREFKPTAFHTRRSDTGAVLGSVGKIYTPLQNTEAFEFLDGLFGEHDMLPESAGSFRDGRKVFITAELPETLIVDPSGFGDHIRQFVAILNSHDGSSPLTAITTPWRIECANTERFAVRDAVTKWTIRHTKNAKNKLAAAADTLNLTTKYYLAWKEEETALVRTPFHDNQIDALCDQIWGELDRENAPKRTVTIEDRKRDTVRDIYRTESERVGRNAYAAERAVTAYLDHYADLRPRGALRGNRLGALGVALMEDTTGETKTKAHKKLLLLSNR